MHLPSLALVGKHFFIGQYPTLPTLMPERAGAHIADSASKFRFFHVDLLSTRRHIKGEAMVMWIQRGVQLTHAAAFRRGVPESGTRARFGVCLRCPCLLTTLRAWPVAPRSAAQAPWIVFYYSEECPTNTYPAAL